MGGKKGCRAAPRTYKVGDCGARGGTIRASSCGRHRVLDGDRAGGEGRGTHGWDGLGPEESRRKFIASKTKEVNSRLSQRGAE